MSCGILSSRHYPPGGKPLSAGDSRNTSWASLAPATPPLTAWSALSTSRGLSDLATESLSDLDKQRLSGKKCCEIQMPARPPSRTETTAGITPLTCPATATTTACAQRAQDLPSHDLSAPNSYRNPRSDARIPPHARAAGLRCELLRAVVAHVGPRSQIELPIFAMSSS